jgi:uncharacterized OB-fold protein
VNRVRTVEKAAAYLPAGVSREHHVAARDEDGFTLAATALERLEDVSQSLAPPSWVLFVGDLPTTAEVDVGRFLGYSVPTARFGAGVAGLTAAMRAAVDPVRAAEPVLIVAVDLAPDEGHRAHSDAAVALRVGERGSTGPPPVFDAPADDWPSTPTVFRWARERGGSEPDAWVGDFGTPVTSTVDAPRDAVARPIIPPGAPVSQGAYVPLPRYLENLPSRWRFWAEKCGACESVTFPPRGRCRQCGATDSLSLTRLPRDGAEVVASTTIGPGGQPTEFDDQVAASGPYGVVLVDLAPGARATLQVADAPPGQVKIGSTVNTRLRRLYAMEGEWRYGRKAVPAP